MLANVTLSQVLAFIQTADPVEITAIASALNGNRPGVSVPLTRTQVAANTLAAITEGSTVAFPYDNVNYKATVDQINRTTATVRITEINGTPRRKMFVGMKIRVPASILARSI